MSCPNGLGNLRVTSSAGAPSRRTMRRAPSLPALSTAAPSSREYFAQLHVRRGQTRPRNRDDAGRIGDENASAARRRLTRRDARERFDQRVRVFPGIDRLAQLAPDRGRIKFEIAGSVDEQLLVHRRGQRENELDQTGHEEQAGDDGERLQPLAVGLGTLVAVSLETIGAPHGVGARRPFGCVQARHP